MKKNELAVGLASQSAADLLNDLITAVRELHDDHATLVDAVTAIRELHDDHATLRSAVAGLKAFAEDRVVTGDPGLAAGTDSSKVKTANQIEFTIDGVGYSKAATDDFWTLTGDAIADGDIRGYVLYVDKSGAASVEATDDVTGSDPADLTWPDLDDDKAVVGCITIAMSGGAFTPGTTGLDNGNATVVYNDGLDLAGLLVKRLPAAPATLTASKPAALATLTASKPAALA